MSQSPSATIFWVASILSVVLVFHILAPSLEVSFESLLAALYQLLGLFRYGNFLVGEFKASILQFFDLS